MVVFSRDGRQIVLRDYQEKAVGTLAEGFKNKKFLVLNDAPGSGKTIVALETLSRLIDKDSTVIVLVPYLYAMRSWLSFFAIGEDGIELRPEPFYAKDHFKCLLDGSKKATDRHIPCNLKTSILDRMAKCPFYAPPISSPPEGSVVLGKYRTLMGRELKVYVRKEAVGRDREMCDYYAQFDKFLEGAGARVIVMTYSKFLIMFVSGLLPHFDWLVLDEIEEVFSSFYPSLEFDSTIFAEIFKYVDKPDKELVEQVVACKRDVDAGRSLSTECLQILKRIVEEREEPTPVFRFNSQLRTIVEKGRFMVIADAFSEIMNWIDRLNVKVLGLTGTPLDQDKFRQLIRAEDIYSFNTKMPGKFLLIDDPRLPKVKVSGIWFKHEHIYRDKVNEVCDIFIQAYEYSMKLDIPIFIPIISYRHAKACRFRDFGIEIDDGTHIDRFLSGERRVLATTRATRGVHFPFPATLVLLLKYPRPDIESLRHKFFSKTRLRYVTDLEAESTFIQILGRGVSRESSIVVVVSPDKDVHDYMISKKGKVFDLEVLSLEKAKEVIESNKISAISR